MELERETYIIIFYTFTLSVIAIYKFYPGSNLIRSPV